MSVKVNSDNCCCHDNENLEILTENVLVEMPGSILAPDGDRGFSGSAN